MKCGKESDRGTYGFGEQEDQLVWHQENEVVSSMGDKSKKWLNLEPTFHGLLEDKQENSKERFFQGIKDRKNHSF